MLVLNLCELIHAAWLKSRKKKHTKTQRELTHRGFVSSIFQHNFLARVVLQDPPKPVKTSNTIFYQIHPKLNKHMFLKLNKTSMIPTNLFYMCQHLHDIPFNLKLNKHMFLNLLNLLLKLLNKCFWIILLMVNAFK